MSRYQSIVYLTLQSQKEADGYNLALSVSELMKCSNAACSVENQEIVFNVASALPLLWGSHLEQLSVIRLPCKQGLD